MATKLTTLRAATPKRRLSSARVRKSAPTSGSSLTTPTDSTPRIAAGAGHKALPMILPGLRLLGASNLRRDRPASTEHALLTKRRVDRSVLQRCRQCADSPRYPSSHRTWFFAERGRDFLRVAVFPRGVYR